MEYAFAALVVIGVIFLVIFNIRTSRRVREQQRRTGEGQGSVDGSALSDRAVRPTSGDPAQLDPTVMQINEILEPVAERSLEDEPELRARGTSTEPDHGVAAGHAVDLGQRAPSGQVAAQDGGAASGVVSERRATSGHAAEHTAITGDVAERGRPETTKHDAEHGRTAITEHAAEHGHKAITEHTAEHGQGATGATTVQFAERGHSTIAEQITKPQYEPGGQHDPSPDTRPESQPGAHASDRAKHNPSPSARTPDRAPHRDDAGAAVDRVLSRTGTGSGTGTGTTTRDEHYRQALRQLAEPERAARPQPEGEDAGIDSGDKAYREALRSILEKKSADQSERGGKNE